MTLTQLNAFVLVARLGSVTAAANALGRQRVRRLPGALRAPAAPGRSAGHPRPGGHDADRRRLPAARPPRRRSSCSAPRRTPPSAPRRARPSSCGWSPPRRIAEFVVSPLTEAFTRRFAGRGRGLGRGGGDQGDGRPGRQPARRRRDRRRPCRRSRRCRWSASRSSSTGSWWSTGRAQARLRGGPRQWRWLVDPAGTDPDSETGQAAGRLGIPDEQDRRLPQPDRRLGGRGRRAGVAPAVEHLVAQQLRRGELSLRRPAGVPGWRPAGTSPCWSGSAAAPPPARCAGSWHPGGHAPDAVARRPAFRRPGSGRRSTSRSGAEPAF